MGTKWTVLSVADSLGVIHGFLGDLFEFAFVVLEAACRLLPRMIARHLLVLAIAEIGYDQLAFAAVGALDRKAHRAACGTAVGESLALSRPTRLASIMVEISPSGWWPRLDLAKGFCKSMPI